MVANDKVVVLEVVAESGEFVIVNLNGVLDFLFSDVAVFRQGLDGRFDLFLYVMVASEVGQGSYLKGCFEGFGSRDFVSAGSFDLQ